LIVISIVKKVPAFVELEGSSLYSCKPAVEPSSEPFKFILYSETLFCKMHCNIILQAALRSPQMIPSLRFPSQTRVFISKFCFNSFKFHPSSEFNHPNCMRCTHEMWMILWQQYK